MRLPQIFIILCCLTGYLRAVPQLLFANRRDIRLVDAGHPNGNATVIVNGLEDAASLDFIYDGNLLFWTDVTLEVIKQTWLNASHISRDIVTTGLVSPDGLACDWLSRKLYWTDSETNRIEVSNLDGSHRKVLFWDGLDQPRAIALDPLNGYMYWTDWGEIPKIERAWMDGAPESRSIIIRDNIHWPNGLTLDYTESRIYWADAKFSFIHSCEFDGSDRREVVVGTLPHPFALTLFDNSLYWTDWQTRSIHSCNKNTGGDRRVIQEDIYSPLDVQVFHPNRQPKGVNPCAGNNGGCSHLCLMSPHPPYYTCACPTGVQLHKDTKTCAMGANKVLLLARRTDLRRISLDTPDYTDIVLPLDNIRHAIAIDYDPIDRYVYWTDDAVHTIRRSYLDGTCQEVVIHADISHPDGLAVDWVARNLYWTDTGTDRIEVARLNGTSRKVLISEDLDEPRAIVVDPISGYMYWTDWGRKPKIERANLDGSERMILINTSLHWPNGLALDYEEQKLYWSDAHTDRIEVADADGSHRRTLVSHDLPHVFGVSQLGEYLYCTDWQRRSIERISKKTGADRSIIIDQLPDLMGLKAVDVTRVEGSNACSHNDNSCSHLCLNRPAPKGPICACPMGLELLANGKTCIEPEAFLLFSRRADIRRISLETKHNDIVIPLAGVKEASALDFDINDSRIYWTDISLKSISRAFMNGSALEQVVVHGLQFPEGLAVDWVARNLYWTDTGTNRIEMSRLDGSSRKVLLWVDLNGPRSIALDPPEGFMYWIDWGTDHKIERALLDGTDRHQLVSNTGRINGLTIDFTDRRLYWTNLDSQMIETSDLLGNHIQPVIKEDIPHPFGLTQYMDYIYWTDWNTRSIERANKTTGSNRTRIQGDLDYVMDILVFHASRQSGWNPCGVNSGGCSHLCIAHPTRYLSRLTHRCACPSHYTLAPDERACLPPDNFLLFSQNRRISRILMGKGVNTTTPDIVLPIQVVRSVRALAFDPVDRVIYWIDGRNKAVKRVAENGTKPSMFLHASQHGSNFVLYDIAIDPYSRHLYWSDSRNNVINVTRLDMSSVGIVITGPHQKPRSIALAPGKGLLFWANLVKPARIERAAMDGTAHMTLFSTELGSPLALTVDVPTGKLFWTDTDLKRIESADFDGGNRQVIVDSQLVQPVGLAVSGDYIYWADKDQQLIERVHKMTGLQRLTVKSRVAQLNSLVAVSMPSDDLIGRHPCSHNNGGCPYLCVGKGGKNVTSRCSCPIGMMLKLDEISCAEPPTCVPTQFTCRIWSTDCIPLVWKCDGYPDCEDESDELDCPKCSRNEFRCKSGQCIVRKERCDGIQQCQDNSDEADCPPCGSTTFECTADKTCIDISLRCNGKRDCSDSQDEYDCTVINRPMQVGLVTNTAQYTISIIVGFVVVLVVLIGVVLACRRKSQQVLLDDSRDIMLVKPLNPTSSSQQSTPPNTLLSSHDQSGTMCMSLNTALHSSGPLLYDRNHVTGASSSSSAVTRYPHETLNPPPSPVTTDTSRCAPYYLSPSPSTMHSSHRHYKKLWRHNPPPQPTPCSTDVFEDSDPYCSKDYACCGDSATELNYDSDPFYPPPPTPRSHYFSDEPSFPPSPSTERSFFNPYPPPPSPVGMSDC